jgi:hypothetical protein
VALPSGAVRQAKFDISVRFECPHARVKYKKKATKDTRKSKHLSCVDCPAFVRFKGCCATDDSSVALVVTAKFIQVCHDPLRQLRKEFEQLNSCVSAEILASDRFAFVFQNCCQAEDAHVAVHGKEHGHFHGKLRAETQNRFIFSVYKCNLKHERHLQPCLPSQRGMYMSYAVSQEVANMAAAGAKPASIINYLTRTGQKGMVTASKVNNIRATIESDISVYSKCPSSKDSICSKPDVAKKRIWTTFFCILSFMKTSQLESQLVMKISSNSHKFGCKLVLVTMTDCVQAMKHQRHPRGWRH